MSEDKTHRGKCFCGAVEFSVTGEPTLVGYCHCSSCRDWAAAPVNAFTLWPIAAVTVTRGAEHVGTYQRTEHNLRKWCKLCGGHLFTDISTWQMADVFTSTIPSLPFVPTMHVHYQESVLPLRDGLPKFRDLPEEAGGSGELLPE